MKAKRIVILLIILALIVAGLLMPRWGIVSCTRSFSGADPQYGPWETGTHVPWIVRYGWKPSILSKLLDGGDILNELRTCP